jgi:hypothetical protein
VTEVSLAAADLIDILPYGDYQRVTVRRSGAGTGKGLEPNEEGATMDVYVSKDQLKEVSDALALEGVNFQVTDKKFSLIVEGKEIGEVAELKAQLVETEMPAILEDAPDIRLRAFRLPSGRRFLLTDVNGNFVRMVTPAPGWER